MLSYSNVKISQLPPGLAAEDTYITVFYGGVGGVVPAAVMHGVLLGGMQCS